MLRFLPFSVDPVSNKFYPLKFDHLSIRLALVERQQTAGHIVQMVIISIQSVRVSTLHSYEVVVVLC